MPVKLNSILLVDDNEAIHFYTEVLLKEMDCAEQVVTAYNGEEAFEYMKTTDRTDNLPPELILLDLNMPKMNGWQFLKRYDQLPEANKNKKTVIIILLTVPLNTEERHKAEQYEAVGGFEKKPLNEEKIASLWKTHFNTP